MIDKSKAQRGTPRRHFLRGAGGFTLALPFLPSLAPASARAAEGNRKPHLVAFFTDHGGVKGSNIFPSSDGLPNKQALFPGHEIRWGALSGQTQGGDMSLSTVLRAPSSRLTPGLLAKMNVLAGIGIPFGIAHHTGGHLGNYARNDGNGPAGQMVQKFPLPTIDQLMAWSPSFYTDLTGIKERALVMGSRPGYSWGWSNPASRSGSVQEVRRIESGKELFDRIFKPSTGQAQPTPASRKPIVDRVLANYKSLRESNRRLSTKDKQRLDDHVARLAELDRRINGSGSGASASCGELKKPQEDAYAFTGVKRFQLLNDIIVAAFICDSSRIASASVTDVLTTFSGSWHQDFAHRWKEPGAQTKLVEHNRAMFADIFVDLATKLDAVDLGGRTLLDDTFITWTQESGASSHDPVNIPVVTAGSAAGYFKTGLFCDYRSMAPSAQYPYVPNEGLYAGLTWNRYLGTILQAMGIPKSEYETASMKGYGHMYAEDTYAKMFGAALNSNSDPLPVIVNA